MKVYEIEDKAAGVLDTDTLEIAYPTEMPPDAVGVLDWGNWRRLGNGKGYAALTMTFPLQGEGESCMFCIRRLLYQLQVPVRIEDYWVAANDRVKPRGIVTSIEEDLMPSLRFSMGIEMERADVYVVGYLTLPSGLEQGVWHDAPFTVRAYEDDLNDLEDVGCAIETYLKEGGDCLLQYRYLGGTCMARVMLGEVWETDERTKQTLRRRLLL